MFEKLIEYAKSFLEGSGVPIIEHLLSKSKKEQGTTITIGDIIYNDYRTIITKDGNSLKNWVKGEGEKHIIEHIKGDFSKPIIEFINNLPSDFGEWTLNDILEIQNLSMLNNYKLPTGKTIQGTIEELIHLIEEQQKSTIVYHVKIRDLSNA